MVWESYAPEIVEGSMGGPALELARITLRMNSWVHGNWKGTPFKLRGGAEYQLIGPYSRGKGHAFRVRARSSPIMTILRITQITLLD